MSVVRVVCTTYSTLCRTELARALDLHVHISHVHSVVDEPELILLLEPELTSYLSLLSVCTSCNSAGGGDCPCTFAG
jgi:hypothetical protein